MNAIVEVAYILSNEYRRARLIQAGENLSQRQIIQVDLATATEAERAAIVGWGGIDLHAAPIAIKTWRAAEDWQDRKPISNELMLDGVPTIQEIVSHCLRMRAELDDAQRIHDDWMRGQISEDIAKKMQAMREHIANRTIGDVDLRNSLSGDRKRLGVDLSEYNALRAQYNAWEAERKSEIDAERAENERQREAEKAAKEAAKQTWVQEHGSDHLKRACAAGHDCSRMYWRERAAIEYPGYIVDIENEGAWKSRSCPSIEALDERDAALAGKGERISARIVWLTAMPMDHKLNDERYDQDEFEACEALVVEDPTYPYDLVKIL